MIIEITSIQAMAGHRPNGYFEDVVSRGIVRGDVLELNESEYIALRKKYNNQTPRRWPLWALALKAISKPQEKGVGDTLARLIVGKESFKQWFKKTFRKSCGCDARQGRLNEMFPYKTVETA